VTNDQFTVVVIIIGLAIAFTIFMVVRSLGKPVVLPEPKEKPVRRPVPARQPRAERQPRPQAQPRARQLAPDDDIEFLRSLNTKRPDSN
jgi:hypothetical protein